MRAALVAGAGAALGLLALANLSTSAPPNLAAKELPLRATLAAAVVSGPLALARQ
jgi:hypothetical protein